MFTIREVRPSDVSTLVDLWLRSVRATHDFLSEEDVQSLLPEVRDVLASGQLELWALASDGESLMGFMGMVGNSVEALFLAPEHLHKGGGRRLLEHARSLKGALTVDIN